METRGQFCRACDQITSGDCGMHGPRIIGPILQATFSPTVQTTPATAREIVERLPMFVVACSHCPKPLSHDYGYAEKANLALAIVTQALDAAVRVERQAIEAADALAEAVEAANDEACMSTMLDGVEHAMMRGTKFDAVIAAARAYRALRAPEAP